MTEFRNLPMIRRAEQPSAPPVHGQQLGSNRKLVYPVHAYTCRGDMSFDRHINQPAHRRMSEINDFRVQPSAPAKAEIIPEDGSSRLPKQ